MNQLIRRLIDVYLVQPLATAVTQHLEGGQQIIMDALDRIKQQLDDALAGQREAKLRSDKLVSRFDDLQKQVAGHPSIDDDPRLAAILAEVKDMTAAAASIVPDPPAAAEAPPAEAPPAEAPPAEESSAPASASSSQSLAEPAGEAPPADPAADDFKAGKDQ